MTSERQSQGAVGKIAALVVFLGAGAAALYWFVLAPAQQIASDPVNDIPVAAAPQQPAASAEPVDTAETDSEVAETAIEDAPETPLATDQETALAEPADEEPVEQTAELETTQTETAELETAEAEASADERAVGLDVVRVQPDGSALVAGFAPSGGDVLIMVDGAEIARAQADGQGKFVALFDMPSSDVPRSLSLGLQDQLGKVQLAKATVLIAPVEGAEQVAQEETEQPIPSAETALLEEVQEAIDQLDTTEAEQSDLTVASIAPSVAPDSDASAQTSVSPDAPVISEAPAPGDAPQLLASADSAPTRDPASAPTIVLADEDGVTVLQPAPRPAAPGPDVASNVVIDTITYDTDGEVALTGRGAAEGYIRVYLDGRAVQSTDVAADGTWAAPLPDVAAGVYSLRIDEVDEDGNVTSRIETPFQREQLNLAVGASGAITVQTGFTLWAIAEANFGDGAQYVRVYEANRDLIRDPDLIYPGQVFEIPMDAQDG